MRVVFSGGQQSPRSKAVLRRNKWQKWGKIMRLKGKAAIVTGGASGFGRGIVDAFVREGASVMIADIDGEAAAAVVDELKASGHTVEAMKVDVTDSVQVAAAVAQVRELLGGLDIMVANAGLGQRPTRIEDTTDEEFERQMAVNVRGVFNCAKHAVPVFREQGFGNIIITSSGIALTPRPNLVVYGATKGAVLTFAKGLAMELAPEHIRVNALCPAAGDTPMLREFMGGTDISEAREKFRESLPMGRFISPADMGEAAVFLASDREAGAITGTALAVDGGRCI